MKLFFFGSDFYHIFNDFLVFMFFFQVELQINYVRYIMFFCAFLSTPRFYLTTWYLHIDCDFLNESSFPIYTVPVFLILSFDPKRTPPNSSFVVADYLM